MPTSTWYCTGTILCTFPLYLYSQNAKPTTDQRQTNDAQRPTTTSTSQTTKTDKPANTQEHPHQTGNQHKHYSYTNTRTRSTKEPTTPTKDKLQRYEAGARAASPKQGAASLGDAQVRGERLVGEELHWGGVVRRRAHRPRRLEMATRNPNHVHTAETVPGKLTHDTHSQAAPVGLEEERTSLCLRSRTKPRPLTYRIFNIQ